MIRKNRIHSSFLGSTIALALILFSAQVVNTCAFGNRNILQNKPISFNKHFSSNNDELPTSSRRDWIKGIAGGATVSGLVANKVAIRGPKPYQPAIGSLTNKVIVITGGNTGLGLESAKRLAAGGATIVLTSRNMQKGAIAVQDIKDYCTDKGVINENVYSLPLDLCDLENVKSFGGVYRKSPVGDKKIDVLMNNAGVMAIPELELTKDGYEKTFQSNHLGHFVLTSVLMPLFNTDGDGSTVINVSSSAYMIAGKGLNLDNLNSEKSYGPWDAYGQSKLQNILFTKELQRRAKEANIKLTSTSLHPGAVRTDLARYVVGKDNFVSMQDKEAQENMKLTPATLALLPLVYFTKSVDRGATTQVWLASGQGGDDIGGRFYQNCKSLSLGPAAEDLESAKALWSISEELGGVKFEL